MITYNFKKQINPEKLHQELQAAGFQDIVITSTEKTCTIYLNDAETKNPTDIVNAHIYTPPEFKTIEQWKEEYKRALSADDKADKLAEFIGLL